MKGFQDVPKPTARHSFESGFGVHPLAAWSAVQEGVHAPASGAYESVRAPYPRHCQLVWQNGD